jgi:hypothetical protein
MHGEQVISTPLSFKEIITLFFKKKKTNQNKSSTVL